jgi:hypothetical protein
MTYTDIKELLGHKTEAMARHYARNADKTKVMKPIVEKHEKALVRRLKSVKLSK